ncbi:MAG: hypothetical protein ACTFAK_16300 [Candidatus Electronema sp. VV]
MRIMCARIAAFMVPPHRREAHVFCQQERSGSLFRFGSKRLLSNNGRFLPSNNLLLLGSRRLSVGCKGLRLEKRRFLPSNNLLLFGRRRLLLSSGRLSVGSNFVVWQKKVVVKQRKVVSRQQTSVV